MVFTSSNLALFLLVITSTIDASRLFYLPLPKLHPSQNVRTSADIDHSNEPKPIHKQLSMEQNKDEEQETEKRNTFDWEALVDRRLLARKRTYSNPDDDLLPASLKQLEEAFSLDRDPRKPSNSATDTVGQNNEVWDVDPKAIERTERLQSNARTTDIEQRKRRNDTLFLMIVGTCSFVGVIGLVAAAIFWYKIQKRAEAAVDSEYPSYGVTGPSSGAKISPSSTMSDRKLAQSAQMYHYQQQRQQMMAQEKANLDVKPVNSDDSDDEAPGGGDYTVYECPGLAPTGEMEVRNPLFAEPDSSLNSSASHPTTNNHYPQPPTTASSSPPKEKSLP